MAARGTGDGVGILVGIAERIALGERPTYVQHVCRLLAALLVAALSLVAGGFAPAGAQQAPLTGQVDAGHDGLFVPGRAVPVRVTLSATALTSGQLTVGFGGRVTEVIDFEVTAGSSEEHWVLLDGLPPEAVVEARVDLGDRVLDLEGGILRWDPQTQLVGVLPGLGNGLELDDAESSTYPQDLQPVTLGPALLDLGPQALAAIDSIAATPDDLASLSDQHRRAILGWLTVGGTLYVDAPPGPVPGWPEALQPVARTTRAGAAEVIATGGALADGRWSETVLPAPHRSIHEDADASANIPGGDIMSELFALDLGRDLPALGGLLAVLAVYILLVGPVAYLVLRRRSMVRWAAIPVLAVLATGVLFATGDGLGDTTIASVVDVIETGPGAATASTRVVFTSDAGGRTLGAPAGWVASPDDATGFDAGGFVQRRSDTGVQISVPTPPGGIGHLTARGPVDLRGALEVSARAATDGTVTGQVRNTTDLALTHVGVFAGRTSSVSVGSLGPGDVAEFELTGTNQFRFGAQPFRELWPPGVLTGDAPAGLGPPTTFAPAPMPPDIGPIVIEQCDESGCEQCDDQGNCFPMQEPMPMQCDAAGNCFPAGPGFVPGPADCIEMGNCDASSPVRTESLAAVMHARGTNAMAPGLITAVGWTTELDPVLDLGSGVQLEEARTAIVGRATPVAAGDRLVDAATVRSLVSVDNEGNVELVFAFEVPPVVGDRPVDPARLRLDLPAMFLRVSVLTPTGEVVVRDAGPNGPFADRAEVVVPPEGLVHDHLHVRAILPFEPPPPGRELVLYEAAAA